jgi:RNA polymerase sigma-70 factor (ECF subfamily)
MTPAGNRRPETGTAPPDTADAQEFAAHYQQVYRRLTLVAAGVTGERSSAEDIVQEAAVIAFEEIHQFERGTNFSAWLAEIVRRCALNHRRKASHRRTFAADPAVLGQISHAHTTNEGPWPIARDTGEVVPDQASFDDELAGALAQLSAEARSCLLLRIVEKLSYAEIAALLHIPEGTAMSHVHRSKAALRLRLAGDARGQPDANLEKDSPGR